MAKARKIQMAVLGLPRDLPGGEGGNCDKCKRDAAVAWVHELWGYRCARCLADVTSLGPSEPVSKDVTEEEPDEDYKVSEAWQNLIANAGKMGPPTSPGPVEDVPDDTPPARPN